MQPRSNLYPHKYTDAVYLCDFFTRTHNVMVFTYIWHVYTLADYLNHADVAAVLSTASCRYAAKHTCRSFKMMSSLG